MIRTRTLAVVALLVGIVGTVFAGELDEFRKAAEQGDAGAQFILGGMYARGEGVAKDDAEAVKWFRSAAAQGHATAQNNLGVMYTYGRGVPKDDEEAVKWYRLAAEQGDADAQYSLGWMYDNGKGLPEDDAEAVKWYRLAAEQGDADAQRKLDVIEADRTAAAAAKVGGSEMEDGTGCFIGLGILSVLGVAIYFLPVVVGRAA